MTFEGLPGVDRELADGTWQAFAYNAASGELVNVQIGTDGSGGALEGAIAIGESLLTS